MMDAFYVIRVDKEEWIAFPKEKQDLLLQRLRASSLIFAPYMVEELEEYTREELEKKHIDIEKTMKHFYGDEEE